MQSILEAAAKEAGTIQVVSEKGLAEEPAWAECTMAAEEATGIDKSGLRKTY